MKISKKITVTFLCALMLLFSSFNSFVLADDSGTTQKYGTLSKTTVEVDNETAWTKWESGSRTIYFKLNNVDTEATVTMPGNPVTATGYMTNANQFGVTLLMDGQSYCYTFANGSSESSGMFFAIENNRSNSPYILRPNYPATNNGSHINPNEVRTDYDYYYADNMVKEETMIELTTGEKFKFVQIVQFENDGIFHRAYMINIGDSDVESFRMIAKVDTFLINDNVPVYYGEMKDTYYIKQNSNSYKLRISGLTGVDGSIATRHQRIWESGFINTYRVYNETLMSTTGAPGTLAFSGDDSEIVYDQKPHTLAVGETSEIVFGVNFLKSNSVTVMYVDEAGNEIAQTEFLQGIVGGDYTAARKDIDGYILKEVPDNETGTFQDAEQLVKYVYEKVYTVTYDGNNNTSGTVPIDTNKYKSQEEATILGQGDLEKDGHTFAGWFPSADGNDTIYKADDRIAITDDITLYAIWTKDESTTSSDPSSSIVSEDSEDTGSGTTSLNSPKTGDTAIMWLAIIILSASVLTVAVLKRKNSLSK